MPQLRRSDQARRASLEVRGLDGRPPLGARVTQDGTRFRLYATGVEQVAVRLVDEAGAPRSEHPLAPVGREAPGEFEACVPDAGHGTLYRLVLDGSAVTDPFARFLPLGVHGPAMVVEPRHLWAHGPGIARPLREHVIYELHVGTFTEAGTYRAAADHLVGLAALGITAVQLMPVGAFAGTRGWGYDVVAHFAPFAPYGAPDDLRAFVDEAHRLRLAVFLDVVYNHFGPAGNYLAAFSDEYFAHDVANAWGVAPDFRRAPMRRLVLENAHYWLREFRFDGLRLDATHAIVDPSARHILRELADEVAALEPRKLLIAEDERNEPDLVERLGLDAVWADDFHHGLRVKLTGEREGYYAAYQPDTAALAETISKGWLYTGQTYAPAGRPRGRPAPGLPAESFVLCIQNHDQVGNRALGDRLSAVVSADVYCVASTVLLFLPMTPLLFMGQEWAASTPFQFFTDHEPALGQLVAQGRREEFKSFAMFSSPELRAAIPDPQDRATFERSRLDWGERTRPVHARVLRLYRDLLALRAQDPVLQRAGRDALEVWATGDVLLVRRSTATGSRVLAANLGPAPVELDHLVTGLGQRPALFDSRSGRVAAETDPLQAAGLAPHGRLPGQTAMIFA